jgi:hypothetical protein
MRMILRSSPRLISVHTPKSSGISLRTALHAAFGSRRVLLDYAHDPVDPATPTPHAIAASIDLRRLRGVRAVHGHFPIQKYDGVSGCVRAVLLREPVDNLISIYYFWTHLIEAGHLEGHALFRSFVAERPSILDFARHPTFRHLLTRTFFGGYAMDRFDVIGDYARRDAYVGAISRLLNVKLDRSVYVHRTPPSAERERTANSRQLTSALRDVLRDDIAFYERWAGRLAS